MSGLIHGLRLMDAMLRASVKGFGYVRASSVPGRNVVDGVAQKCGIAVHLLLHVVRFMTWCARGVQEAASYVGTVWRVAATQVGSW